MRGGLSSALCALFLFLFSSNIFAYTNSEPAFKQKYNFVVNLIIPGYIEGTRDVVNGYCNGSVISEKYILTAAHCFIRSLQKLHLAKVSIESYTHRILKNGSQFTFFEKKMEHKIKKVHFLKNYYNYIRNHGAHIPIHKDLALIELKEPINLETLEIEPVKVVSREDFKLIKNNLEILDLYGVSINYISSNDIYYRRKAFFKKFSIESFARFLIGNYIWSFDSQSQLTPTDSGSPLLVQINHQTKLVGVAKGLASSVIYEASAFAPVAHSMCELTRNTKLVSEYCD